MLKIFIYIRLNVNLCKTRLCPSMSTRKHSMESENRSDHLHRTATNFRAQLTSKATVKEINDISPTVKKLTLEVQDKNFSFKAGQWVDFTIPGVDTVGGFSMCSSPKLLSSKGVLDLAVKHSTHPPALWVHTKCLPGKEVLLRIGGDFYYDPATVGSKDLVLIGGGVGINPLYSIMQCFADDIKGTNEKHPVLYLLYSARTSNEILFEKEIKNICYKFENIKVKFFITKEECKESSDSGISTLHQRIDTPVLQDIFQTHFTNLDNVICYLCGPGSMTDILEQKLMKLSLTKQQIIYEKWW